MPQSSKRRDSCNSNLAGQGDDTGSGNIIQSQCFFCSSRALSFCESMKAHDLEKLDRLRAGTSLEAGQNLFDEGEDATHIYNLTSGSVKLFKLLPDGRRQITGFLFMGDFFGYVGQSNNQYIYSAEALTKTTMCKFPRNELNALMAEYPQIELSILKTTSNELAEAQQQMLLLGRMTALERIASFYIMLSRRAVKRGQKDNPVSVPMGQIDIGDYLGLTTETVSRSLSRLKKQGLIQQEKDRKVRILDYPALERMAKGD